MTVEIYSTDTDSGQISVICKEGSTYRTVKEIPIGNAPRGGVKFTRDGRGFVSNTSANTVSELDALSHREVTRITVGFGPRGLGIVPGERYLLVSNTPAVDRDLAGAVREGCVSPVTTGAWRQKIRQPRRGH